MNAVLHVARAEVLEHRRQPWMLLILVFSYVFYLALPATVLHFICSVLDDPVQGKQLRDQAAAIGADVDTFLLMGVVAILTLLFANLPLFVAYLSGYSVLHDRTCGTMPFLMLAPMSRRQLLLGKLLGVLAIPTALHLVFVGPGSMIAFSFAERTGHTVMFQLNGAWWVAYLLGAPLSATVVGALGTVISARSRDVRTSVQYVCFFVGLLSLVSTFVLVENLSKGIGLQLAFVAGCLVAATVTWLVGAALISRDIEPAP
jgi:ABC-type transport system involved in multi-copper enzyme maturation permease subunit